MGCFPRHTVRVMAEGRVSRSESLVSLPGPVCAHPQRWHRGRGFPLPPRSPQLCPLSLVLSALAPGQTLGAQAPGLSSIAPDGDGSTTAAGSGSPSCGGLGQLRAAGW